MLGLDTNVLVRYFANDDAAQSAKATRLIERTLTVENPGYVSLVVLAEMVWVITISYGADRATVIKVVEGLLAAPQFKVQEAEQVWRSIRSYRESKAGFSDVLIAELARVAGCSKTYTFDRQAAKHGGFELLLK